MSVCAATEMSYGGTTNGSAAAEYASAKLAVDEALGKQVPVVPAPLRELACERDDVGPAMNGVPEHVLAASDAADEVVIGDHSRNRERRGGQVRGSGRSGHV